MKKQLSEFEIFECTMTPVGLMMRVFDGWVVNGTFVLDTGKLRITEAEVFDTKNKLDGTYAETMHNLLDNIHGSQFTIEKPLRQDVVQMSVVRRLFAELGFVKDCPF